MRKNFLKNLDDYLGNTAMMAIVIITVTAVITRYVMNRPILWVEEILITIYLWAIMLGAVCAMKHRKHISIDVFFAMLSPKGQQYAQYINDVICIVVLCTPLAGWACNWHWNRTTKSRPSCRFPTSISISPFPSAASGWRSICSGHMISDFKKHRLGEKKNERRNCLPRPDHRLCHQPAGLHRRHLIQPRVPFPGRRRQPDDCRTTHRGASENTTLLAIPFFIFLGNRLNHAGITRRLLQLSDVLTGHMKGGLAQSNVMLSALMGGMSASTWPTAPCCAKCSSRK